MSSKGKRSEGRPVEADVAQVIPVRAKVKVPDAVVSARHGTGMISRQGRGYSLGEVAGAGLNPRLAVEGGVRVDVRRRSILQGNVESLKEWSGRHTAAKKPTGRIKKVEAEVEKVVKEVEKEAAEAKEEVVKVEKAAKKEAAKAERAVKAKVAKPRAKPKKKAKA